MNTSKKKFLRRTSVKDTNDGAPASCSELDEEMDEVFAMSKEDRFDLSRFSSPGENSKERPYCEKEYTSGYQRKSYPHIHIPLKSAKSYFSRRKTLPKDHEIQLENGNSNDVPNTITDVDVVGHPSKKLDTRGSADIDTVKAHPQKESGLLSVVSSCDENRDSPIVSQRAAYDASRYSISPDKKVHFYVDKKWKKEKSDNEEVVSNKFKEEDTEKIDHRIKRKHSRHRKFRKSAPGGKELNKQTQRPENVEDDSYHLVLQLEEPLEEFIQDDLASHRFDCSKEKRRFSNKHSVSSVLTNKKGTEGSIISSLPIRLKKCIDHSPHEVFVQLDELTGYGEEREWKETARWIKYEEDVEEGADRWGKPHVASLSFHSLLNLRRGLESGVILLDLEEKDLPGITYRVVERMVIEELIKEEEKPTIIRALLLRHRHVNDHEKFRFNTRRNASSYTSLQNLNEDNRHKTKFSVNSIDVPSTKSFLNINDQDKPNHTTVDMKEENTYSSSAEDISRKTQRESILKRIPEGAEATTVLIGTVDFLQQPAIAFIRLAEAIPLPALTEVPIPVRFMFILLGPPDSDVDYHEIGRSISTLMSNSDFNKKAYKASGRRELQSAINEFLDFSIVLPPGDWEREALLSLRELRAKNEAIRKRRNEILETSPVEKTGLLTEDDEKKDPFDNPLRRTRKLFGGMINDLKRRYPLYLSDFKDGLNGQCFSAAIFMYFAALSAAITFGGLYAGKTSNWIGISETLVSTSLAGIMFALFAGQPLIIIGATGPLLLFDQSLYTFCKGNDIDYLTMRVYIGFWLTVIGLIVASIEGSVFIKLLTRFTEDIFSSLISLLYILESVTNCIKVFAIHPLMNLSEYCSQWNENDSNHTTSYKKASIGPYEVRQPNTALFSLILSLGTFFLAYYLRHFRNSKFLGRSARRALGDFGVPIAIVVMVALDAVTPATYTEKLILPEGFSPTMPDNRSWIISPIDFRQVVDGSEGTRKVELWIMLAACIPALLLYILVFMETHICELIVGKKERKLKKGNGFHLDIVLVCLANMGCGFMGAPWMCAATVRSVTHVSSVTVMSTTHAPGENPHIIQLREQRVSSLLVAILVGLSVFMSSFLRLVPMAVLFGVFLYMGISSIDGVQFFQRLKLFLIPVKHHPQVAYVRKVKTAKMHLFTIIQLGCLIILWIVKESSLSLSLPFFLILMIPLRDQMQHIFSPSELRALDSDEPDAIDKDDEPDFYVESLLPG